VNSVDASREFERGITKSNLDAPYSNSYAGLFVNQWLQTRLKINRITNTKPSTLFQSAVSLKIIHKNLDDASHFHHHHFYILVFNRLHVSSSVLLYAVRWYISPLLLFVCHTVCNVGLLG
jgi:hypothetical protein